MPSPSRPPATGQLAVETVGPTVSIASATMKRREIWVVPAVVLLTAAMFSAGYLQVFSASRSTTLMAQLIAWSVAAVMVIIALPGKLPFQLESPVGRAMGVFTATFVFSTGLIYVAGIRLDTSRWLSQVAALLIMMLPFFVFQATAKRVWIEPAVLLTCHVVLTLCVASIFGDFLGITAYERARGRFFGFLGDGVAWALTLPLLVYFCSKRLVLAAISVVALALTGSRAPALCVAAGFVLLLAIGRGRRLHYFLTMLFVAGAVAYQSDLFALLLDRLSGTQLINNERISTAALGLRVFEFSPVYGSGYNAQQYYFPQNARRIELGLFSVPTSTFIQMLAEGGLVLFVAFLGFVIVTTVGGIALIRNPPTQRDFGVTNGAVVWLVVMMWVNQSASWFLVGSYMGVLVFGVAGMVSGYYARLQFARRQMLMAGEQR